MEMYVQRFPPDTPQLRFEVAKKQWALANEARYRWLQGKAAEASAE
jgi:hypothetical protein